LTFFIAPAREEKSAECQPETPSRLHSSRLVARGLPTTHRSDQDAAK
jgi:hypothetical protein